MTKKDNQDEFIDKLYKLKIIHASETTEHLNNLSEHQYKYYASRVIDLQDLLNNTPKIFKNKRAKIEQEIKQVQDKSDKFFNDYLKGCEDLYKLHQELSKNQV